MIIIRDHIICYCDKCKARIEVDNIAGLDALGWKWDEVRKQLLCSTCPIRPTQLELDL